METPIPRRVRPLYQAQYSTRHRGSRGTWNGLHPPSASGRDDGLARCRCNLALEFVALLAGSVSRGEESRVMPNMNNRPPLPPPGRQKSRDVLFSVRVIPRPLEGVVVGVDRLLDVDDQQGGMGKLRHGCNSLAERRMYHIAALTCVTRSRAPTRCARGPHILYLAALATHGRRDRKP